MTKAHLVFSLFVSLMSVYPAWSKAADNGEDTDTESNAPLTYYGDDRLGAKGVGITGGAIGGAEIVASIQAACGLDKWWMYVVFPALGAGAGGVGGYYLEKASAPGAVALLVTAVAAVIPTAILVSSAFAYDPEKEGAVKADTMDEGDYSFEQLPEGAGASSGRTEETKTEVEAVPETEGPPEPPPSGQTGLVDKVRRSKTSNAEPTEQTDSDQPAPADGAPEDGAPEDGAPEERSPDNEDAPPISDRSRRHKDRVAVYRPSGTLLHVQRNGAASFSVPIIDISPAGFSASFPQWENGIRRAKGIEVHIPLLRVDLP